MPRNFGRTDECRTAIVITTIYVPECLKSYIEDAQKFDHQIMIVVVADKKTPDAAATFCEELQRQHGTQIEYFSVARQEEYLQRFPMLKDHLPYNSIQRRNIGLLYAYE